MLLKRALAAPDRILPAKSLTPDMLRELDALRRNDPFVFSGISAKKPVPGKPWLGNYTSQFFTEDPYVAANYVNPRGMLGGLGFRPKGIELREFTGEGTPVVQDFRRVKKSPGDYVDTYGEYGDYDATERMMARANPDPRAEDVYELSLPDVQDDNLFWKMLNVKDTAMMPDLRSTKEVLDPVQYWMPTLRTKSAVLKKKGGSV
jgi:hypothetical protein